MPSAPAFLSARAMRRLDVALAIWAVFWIAVAVYTGYDSAGDRDRPLWWDVVAVAVFSVIIYLWAMAVALPTERIEEMIGDVVLPEEGDAAADEALARDV
jgi:uncharacterized membrane-anchored protein